MFDGKDLVRMDKKVKIKKMSYKCFCMKTSYLGWVDGNDGGRERLHNNVGGLRMLSLEV